MGPGWKLGWLVGGDVETYGKELLATCTAKATKTIADTVTQKIRNKQLVKGISSHSPLSSVIVYPRLRRIHEGRDTSQCPFQTVTSIARDKCISSIKQILDNQPSCKYSQASRGRSLYYGLNRLEKIPRLSPNRVLRLKDSDLDRVDSECKRSRVVVSNLYEVAEREKPQKVPL